MSIDYPIVALVEIALDHGVSVHNDTLLDVSLKQIDVAIVGPPTKT